MDLKEAYFSRGLAKLRLVEDKDTNRVKYSFFSLMKNG